MQISSEVLEKIKDANIQHLPNSFPSKVFSWNDLECVLNLRPFVNDKRMIFINQNGYNWKVQSWMTDPNTFPPSLLDTEIRKYTAYLADATRLNAALNETAKELEELFIGASVDAHIYFCLSDDLTAGFNIHFDYSHNLIVQLEGSSKIEIWNKKSYDDSARIVDSLDETPVIDVVMNPGDAVFVPMNTYHRVNSLEKRMSVSFPISYNNTACQDRHWIKLF